MPVAKAAVVLPLAPDRYKVQVTISREAHDNLRCAQDLLRHTIPTGDPAQIVERALALLVEDLEKKKLARAKRPRPAGVQASGSRHVPAAVKRDVWARDAGRCAFVGAAAVSNEASWNSTTSSRSPTVARPTRRTFSYGAASTTRTRRRRGSGR